MAAKLSLLDQEWTRQPQERVSLKKEFDHKGKGFCFLPSLGFFTTNGKSVSLSITSPDYSGPRFMPGVGGRAIRLYAQEGGGTNDDRLQAPFSMATAKSGPMTTILVVHSLSSGDCWYLPDGLYAGAANGHSAGISGSALEIGYDGFNGYSRLSSSIDASPLFLGPQAIVISTVPGQDINAAMSGKLAIGYNGSASYIGNGTISSSARSTTGSGGFDNYYNPNCLIYLWAQLPGVFLSAERVLSVSRYPWQIFEPDEMPWFTPIITAQYARPVSDASAGTWTASTGVDLYAMLDETSADDSDYIVTTGASTCEVALGILSDPASSTGHIVRYRISAVSGGITVRLRQGTTTIATWVHAPAPTSFTTYEQTLSGAESDSITNYTALKLQFEATT